MLSQPLQNSLWLTACVCLLTTFIGWVTAIATCLQGRIIRRFLIVAALMQLALPPFFLINWWMQRLSTSSSWRHWLDWNLYSMGGAVWLCSLLFWPIPFFVMLRSIRQLNTELLDTEPWLKDWQLLVHWFWPALRLPCLISLALVALLTFNQLNVPSLLQIPTWTADLLVRYSATLEWQPILEDLSLPLLLSCLLLLGLRPRAIPGLLQGRSVSASTLRRCLSPWLIHALNLLTCLWILVGLLLPVGDFLLSREHWRASLTAAAAGQQASLNSLLIAFSVASLVILFGWLGRFQWMGRLGWIPLILPGTIIGACLLSLTQASPVSLQPVATPICLIAMTLRYGVLGWAGSRLAQQALDPALGDLARLDRFNGIQRIRHAFLPQTGWILGLAWYGTYLLCLWDAETLLFLIPPGSETLSLRIFNLLHYGHTSQVDGLLLIQIGLATLPLVCFGIGSWVKGATQQAKLKPFLNGLIVTGSTLFVSGCQPSEPNESLPESSLFEEVLVIGSQGRSPGYFIKPRSLTVDGSDNLYVVDMTGRVQKFDAEGTFVLQWQMPELERGKPKGMGIDSQGNIIVIEPHYSRVNHFTSDGILVKQWGNYGTSEGLLTLPRSVAIGLNGHLIISEYQGAERLQVFQEPAMNFLFAIGSQGSEVGHFNRPEGVTCDKAGNLYVADSCNHRIQVFDPTGTWLKAFGEPGSDAGSMSYPYDLVWDHQNHLYVCEFGNSRIQVLNDQGKTLEILGGPGSAVGKLSNPWSIALDSTGSLYVADAANHRVQKWIRKPSTTSP